MTFSFKNHIKKYIEYYNSWKDNNEEYNHLKSLVKSVKCKQIINKKIVFNIVRTVKSQIDRELFIALLLSLHGAKCYVLFDDGILKLNEIYQVDNFQNLRDLYSFNLNSYPHFHLQSTKFLDKILNKIHLKNH